MTTPTKEPRQKTPTARIAKKPKSVADADLDAALEDSFPASDPPSMTQPETETGAPPNLYSRNNGRR